MFILIAKKYFLNTDTIFVAQSHLYNVFPTPGDILNNCN